MSCDGSHHVVCSAPTGSTTLSPVILAATLGDVCGCIALFWVGDLLGSQGGVSFHCDRRVVPIWSCGNGSISSASKQWIDPYISSPVSHFCAKVGVLASLPGRFRSENLLSPPGLRTTHDRKVFANRLIAFSPFSNC